MKCQLCKKDATHQVTAETVKTYVDGQYVELRDPYVCNDCRINLKYQLPGIHFRDLEHNTYEGLGDKPSWMRDR